MPDTAVTHDPIVELANWARTVGSLYAKDLRALPAGAYTTNLGGQSRDPHDYTSEVAGMNFLTAAKVRGEDVPTRSDEERAAFKASLDTVQKGIDAVNASANMLADALVAHRDSLGEMTMAPWGAEITRFGLANVAISHVMYHDGHLTQHQMVLGDADMHWFDPDPE